MEEYEKDGLCAGIRQGLVVAAGKAGRQGGGDGGRGGK